MAEKSGIENFFDVGGQSQIDANDPLSWENISNRQVNVDGNESVNRKPGGTDDYSSSVGVSGNGSTGRIDCLRAEDCGSGFVCVQGECVLNNTAGQSQSGGVTTTVCGTTPPLPGLPSGNYVDPCGEQGAPCIETAGPGGCLELPDIELNCCGQQKYRCCFEGKCNDQCFPCFEIDLDFPTIPMPGFPDIEIPDFDFPVPPNQPPGNPFPPPRTCNPFGDADEGNFGGGDGCKNECSVCINGTCEQKKSGPCFCFPDSCSECTSCKDNGSCGDPPPGQCRTYCNCSVWCADCNKRIYGKYSVPYPPQTGLACPSACRQELAKKCPDCNPPPDPCKANPNDPCETKCRCVTRRTDCNGPPPCPAGKKCKSLGFLNAEPCVERTWFIKECDPPPDNCGDDCRTRGCGECSTCNQSTGKCEAIPDCDDDDKLCPGEVCDDGTCCGGPEGGVCVPTVTYKATDTCHGATSTFTAGGGAPSTTVTATISAKDAVCDRAHTHCSIQICGKTVGSTLDCGKGVSKVSVSQRTTCSRGCY